MDYRFVYRDNSGHFWAVTDYGLLRLNPRQRQRRRAARRRATLLLVATAGLALGLMLTTLIWR